MAKTFLFAQGYREPFMADLGEIKDALWPGFDAALFMVVRKVDDLAHCRNYSRGVFPDESGLHSCMDNLTKVLKMA